MMRMEPLLTIRRARRARRTRRTNLLRLQEESKRSLEKQKADAVAAVASADLLSRKTKQPSTRSRKTLFRAVLCDWRIEPSSCVPNAWFLQTISPVSTKFSVLPLRLPPRHPALLARHQAPQRPPSQPLPRHTLVLVEARSLSWT